MKAINGMSTVKKCTVFQHFLSIFTLKDGLNIQKKSVSVSDVTKGGVFDILMRCFGAFLGVDTCLTFMNINCQNGK